jgi:hypothetical protein
MPSGPSSPHPALADLQTVFGTRLEAFVTYAPGRSPQPSLAIVTSLTFDDLAACARQSRRWQRAGAATPVVLARAEFARALDAFPVEFGEIIATHTTLLGDDPFAGLSVAPADLRRACETQVRSLLLHLREDYMEAGGEGRTVRALVIESAPEFRSLLSQLARLDGKRLGHEDLPAWASERLGLDRHIVAMLVQAAAQPGRAPADLGNQFRAYLAAVDLLARRIDEWQ